MNYYVDRVITITGPPENAAKAEALLSEKMRKCFERDMQNYVSILNLKNSVKNLDYLLFSSG